MKAGGEILLSSQSQARPPIFHPQILRKSHRDKLFMRQDGHAFRPARVLARLAMANVAFLYLVLSLLGVIPLVLLTPPFQVPDEPQHLFRAYQLSELDLRSVVQAGSAGAVLPSSLVELADRFLGSRAIHTSRPVNPSPLNNTLGALRIPLDPGRREFTDFTGAAFYSPLPYLPQVAAVFIGRLAGFGPLGLLYAARLANGLTALLIVTAALRVLPVGGMALFVLGLLPMVLFQFASASPDAAVISTAFLFTAIAMRARFRRHWSGMEVGVACLAGAVFCSLKPVYAPLLMIGLPAALRRVSAGHVLAVHAVLVAVVLGTTALWQTYSSSSLVLPFEGTNLSAQLAGIMAHPGPFAMTVARTLWWNTPFFFHSMIGQLGWLTIKLPAIMYLMPVAALLVCMLLGSRAQEPRIGLVEAAWQSVLLGASGLLIFVALYLYCTPVGLGVVNGVQGRYFLPLAGLVAVVLSATIPSLRLHKPLPVLIVFFLVATEVLLTSGVVAYSYEVL